MAKYEAIVELELPSGAVVTAGETVDSKHLGGDVTALLSQGYIVKPGDTPEPMRPNGYVEIDLSCPGGIPVPAPEPDEEDAADDSAKGDEG